MAGPLEGIRVVDLTNMAAGPLATHVLAEQGAAVIKVEPPTGDPIRGLGSPGANGMSAVFHTLNRGKRSIALDLGRPRGLELLEQLVARADVFAHNLRPDTAQRRGVAESQLRQLSPDLVYVSISGFGEKGPLGGRRAYDTILQARSGFAGLQAQADPEGRPRFVHTAVCDKLTGLYTAQAVTAALLARERGAGGQHVRLAMLDAAIAFLWSDAMQQYTWIREDHELPPRAPMPHVRETSDGFVTLSAHWDAEFRALCEVLEAPELLADPRFADVQARSRHVGPLDEHIDAILRRRPTAVWLELLEAVDVACAPVYAAGQVLDDPQVRANGVLVEAEHPSEGPVRGPRPVAHFSPSAAPGTLTAPRLGEHGRDILRELELADAEIDALVRDGITV